MPASPFYLPLASALLLAVSTIAHAGTPEGLIALQAKDYATARKEFIAAAKEGDLEAFRQIGFLYFFGKGVERSTFRANSWVRYAARRGHLPSVLLYAAFLHTGEAAIRNDDDAMAWYTYAAKQGSPEGQENIRSLKNSPERRQIKVAKIAGQIEFDIKSQLDKDAKDKAAGKPDAELKELLKE